MQHGACRKHGESNALLYAKHAENEADKGCAGTTRRTSGNKREMQVITSLFNET